MREEAALERLAEDVIRGQVSNGARALVTLAFGLDEGDRGFPESRQRLLDLYMTLLGRHTTLFPGLQDLIDGLHARGLCWGIVTNKPSYLTDELLRRIDIQPAPATVICPDHVTNTKPHPEPMYLACKEMGCSPAEVLYVGDHLRDIQAGLAAGMQTIAAAYGYLAEGEDIIDWRAHHVVHHGDQLLPLITRYF